MKIILIMGVPRSGTSVIARYIASSKDSAFFCKLSRYISGIKYRIANKLMLNIKIESQLTNIDGGKKIFDELISFYDNHGVEEARKYFFKNIDKEKVFFVNKRIANIFVVDKIMDIFPHADLILVERRRESVFNSIKKQREYSGGIGFRWGDIPPNVIENPDPIKDIENIIDEYEKLLSELSDKYPSVNKINYNDFCRDPEKEIQKIMKIVGINTKFNFNEKIVEKV